MLRKVACHSGALAQRANPEIQKPTQCLGLDSGFAAFGRAPE
jgi:hypothetical protein